MACKAGFDFLALVAPWSQRKTAQPGTLERNRHNRQAAGAASAHPVTVEQTQRRQRCHQLQMVLKLKISDYLVTTIWAATAMVVKV
jgi:hypothetical protein